MKNAVKLWPRPASAARLNERGVTLVETIVALGILALGVAGMGDFLTHQIRMSQQNNHQTIAYTLVEEELEFMRSLKFSNMDGVAKEKQEGGITFTVETTVADGVPAPNMKEITVNVSWNDPSGLQNVSVPTIYTAIQG